MAPKRRVKKPHLEVRSAADGAWYDGDVVVEGSQMRVRFSGFDDDEDEVWNEEILRSPTKIAERVRLRSKQLQDAKCSAVSAGMVVCANFKTPTESKYYDARVVQVFSRKHSHPRNIQGEKCNCRFKVAWASGPDKNKEVELGCGDISFIADENVEKHPVARVLLRRARNHEQQLSTAVSEETKQLSVSNNKRDFVSMIRDTEGFSPEMPEEPKQLSVSNNKRDFVSMIKDTEGFSPEFLARDKNLQTLLENLCGGVTSLKSEFDKCHAKANGPR